MADDFARPLDFDPAGSAGPAECAKQLKDAGATYDDSQRPLGRVPFVEPEPEEDA